MSVWNVCKHWRKHFVNVKKGRKEGWKWVDQVLLIIDSLETEKLYPVCFNTDILNECASFGTFTID